MMNYHLAEFVTSYYDVKKIPETVQNEFVFAGRSNVGKSSLINKLCNRKNLARVSSVPGKTACINHYEIDGVPFFDLPGYGYAKVSKDEKERWGSLIEDYFALNRPVCTIFLLVDFRHPASQDDLQMMEYLNVKQIPFTVLFSKYDKLGKMAREKREQEIPLEIPFLGNNFILFSSQTGEGINQIKEKINICTELV